MASPRHLSFDEIQKQSVFSTELWSILLPERPINQNHLMIVANRSDANEFISLTDTELAGLRDVIAYLLEKTAMNMTEDLIGYNLFSNNGTLDAGQHLDRFHQHIFIRMSDEEESPYAVMTKGQRWTVIDSKEWVMRRDALRRLFKL